MVVKVSARREVGREESSLVNIKGAALPILQPLSSSWDYYITAFNRVWVVL